MRSSLPMTKAYGSVLEHQIATTVPGMAHWANSGPFGTYCHQCAHWGYHKVRRTAAGDAVKSKHVSACAKFHELTNKHGPTVPAGTPSCKYFQRREGEEK
jgi:hypothetical protein